MTKYTQSYTQQQSKPRPWDVHPIWRGIGCIFIFLIPIVSYAGAVLLIQANAKQSWIDLPREITGYFVLPFLGRIYYLYLVVALVLMVVGFGILTVVYSFVYRFIGPPKYGPMDAPPERISRRRR
jgi:hypothetical protein